MHYYIKTVSELLNSEKLKFIHCFFCDYRKVAVQHTLNHRRKAKENMPAF